MFAGHTISSLSSSSLLRCSSGTCRCRNTVRPLSTSTLLRRAHLALPLQRGAVIHPPRHYTAIVRPPRHCTAVAPMCDAPVCCVGTGNAVVVVITPRRHNAFALFRCQSSGTGSGHCVPWLLAGFWVGFRLGCSCGLNGLHHYPKHPFWQRGTILPHRTSSQEKSVSPGQPHATTFDLCHSFMALPVRVSLQLRHTGHRGHSRWVIESELCLARLCVRGAAKTFVYTHSRNLKKH